MAENGNFPVNEYIIDTNQGAKLVHYIGTFGNVKALKTFMMKFDLDVTQTDKNGCTLIHYAARRGELAMLQYLRELGKENGVDLEMENTYGMTPIVYAMMNNQV